MAALRLSGLVGLWIGLALPLATVPAAVGQVSGEILVDQSGDALMAATRPADDVAPAGDLKEPEPVLLPQPVYPRAARAARQEGRVMVCFTLDERGRVLEPAVRATTDEVFNAPVLEAISAARFTPARVGREPVRSTACRTFRFVLR